MAKCRSCGAEIIWIKMKSGKNMPCDAQKISFDLASPGDDKALVLVEPCGKIARGYYNPGGEKVGYISHFATCPYASKHRKRG